MKFSEEKIRSFIRKTILEQAPLRAQITPVEDQALEIVKAVINTIGAGPLVDILLSASEETNQHSDSANTILSTVMSLTSASLLKSKSGNLKKLGGILGFATGLYGAFTYLPELLEKSTKQLKTIEGVLLKQRKLGRKPIDKLSSVETKSPITGTTFTHQLVVDAIASSIDSADPSERGLYGKLIASSYMSLDGKTAQGPVITDRFAKEIMQRRKILKEEANKIMQKLVTEKWKDLSPKIKKDFAALAIKAQQKNKA